MKKHIPNFITSCNLLCGCISIFFSMNINEQWAALFIFFALLFDFADGLAARLLKTSSEIGVQLDSLSDVVSFGVAPAFILINMFTFHTADFDSSLMGLKYFAFLIPVFGALRLAKFNVDKRQHEVFLGLPIPSAGIFVASLPLIYLSNGFLKSYIGNPWVLVAIAVFLSGMMVTELPLFSLKLKNISTDANRVQLVFLFVSLFLVIMFSVSAVPMIILLYILLSLLGKKYFYSPTK
ncbi:MAG: CDP-diacylglycerol--serine O-phosphatidyltransferase [Bacteroidia bacterium]|nr:CDP-diacylglycerol--serine O-phosphatidyltransferase [Bacteroidia bacterium]